MNKTPEQKARDNIDRMLERSGWAVVDKNAINWSLGPGLTDYVLFVDREGRDREKRRKGGTPIFLDIE